MHQINTERKKASWRSVTLHESMQTFTGSSTSQLYQRNFPGITTTWQKTQKPEKMIIKYFYNAFQITGLQRKYVDETHLYKSEFIKNGNSPCIK